MKINKSQQIDTSIVIGFILIGLVSAVIYSNWQKQMFTSSIVLYVNLPTKASDETNKFYARSQSKDITDSLNALFPSSEFIDRVSYAGVSVPPQYSVKKISPQLLRLSATGADQSKISTDLETFTKASLSEVAKIDPSLDSDKIRYVSEQPSVASKMGKLFINILAGILGGAVVAGVVLTFKNYR